MRAWVACAAVLLAGCSIDFNDHPTPVRVAAGVVRLRVQHAESAWPEPVDPGFAATGVPANTLALTATVMLEASLAAVDSRSAQVRIEAASLVRTRDGVTLPATFVARRGALEVIESGQSRGYNVGLRATLPAPLVGELCHESYRLDLHAHDLAFDDSTIAVTTAAFQPEVDLCPADGADAGQTLVGGPRLAVSLAVRGETLFWLEPLGTRRLMRADLGGEPTPVADDVVAFAADDDWVFWLSSAGAVTRARVSGGEIETLSAAPAEASTPGAIAVAGGFVFWSTTRVAPGAGAAGRYPLFRAPVNGGTAAVVADLGRPALSFAVDQDRLLFTDGLAVDVVAASGGAPTELASVTGGGTLLAIAAKGGQAYWSNGFTSEDLGTGWQVNSTSLVGGPIAQLATFLSRPSAPKNAPLAVDETWVYVGDQQGALLRLPTAGGDPETVAHGVGYLAGIALDDAYVYWVVGQTGDIRRAPKTGRP